MDEPIISRSYEEVDGVRVVTMEKWWLEGKCHRVDGPAWRRWKIVGGLPILTQEQWCLEDKWHRVDGPARITWAVVNGVGVLISEGWYLEGKCHRVDGPASMDWELVVDGVGNVTRVLTYEGWELEAKYHRVDGPASMDWELVDGVGVLIGEGWYLCGKSLDKSLIPTTAVTLQRWFRKHQRRRWRQIERHLQSSGLIIWPGLLRLLRSY